MDIPLTCRGGPQAVGGWFSCDCLGEAGGGAGPIVFADEVEKEETNAAASGPRAGVNIPDDAWRMRAPRFPIE
jgi:hypothetical protein